jgi:hypothetical protein
VKYIELVSSSPPAPAGVVFSWGFRVVSLFYFDLCERGEEASTTNGDKHQSIMAQHEGRFPQLWHAWLT